MTSIIAAACIGFPLGYFIGWTVDPDGPFMWLARVLVGAESMEVQLRAFALDCAASIRALEKP